MTGSFACQLAFFNTATRYFFSMGREGVLPRSLGRTHPVHRSAYIASSLVGVLCGLIVAGFLLHDSSTLGALLKLGTWVPMMGNIGILSIMALVSVAIIQYFATTARDGQHWWNTILAPIIATGAMCVTTFLLIKYRTTLAGGVEPFFVKWIWIPPLAGVHPRRRARADLQDAATVPATTASAATCTRTSRPSDAAQIAGRRRNGRRPAIRAASCANARASASGACR